MYDVKDPLPRAGRSQPAPADLRPPRGAEGPSRGNDGPSRARVRGVHGWPTAVWVLGVSTAVCALIESRFDPANLITVYLAGVVYVALRCGRSAAVLTVLCSVLLFDWLFVAPRGSLKPADPQHFFSFAVMLVVGLIVSHLAGQAQRQTAAVEARARRTQALNQLALQLARARFPAAIGDALQASVRQALGRSAWLWPADDGQLAIVDDATPLSRLAAQALAERRATGTGTEVDPDADWHCLPLLAAGGGLGVLAVGRADAGSADLPEDRALLEAIANQAAVALERALYEQRSARTAVEAERERLRSTLLAGISHDVRTPLTTIVGSATSLLEQRAMLDDEQRDALLRSVLSEARRLHLLTSDLLDLTRMEEGAVRPQPEWCPADELVDEARAALGSRLDDHPLRTEVAADAVVWCDPRLVGQALANLLDNAVRHTAPGTAVRVTVGVQPGSWRLRVHDQGRGVPDGQEREIFKKFNRGGRGADARGTGLGLAICAAVAELHGGRIAAHNDEGLCVELWLPQPEVPAVGLQEVD